MKFPGNVQDISATLPGFSHSFIVIPISPISFLFSYFCGPSAKRRCGLDDFGVDREVQEDIRINFHQEILQRWSDANWFPGNCEDINRRTRVRFQRPEFRNRH